MSQQEIGGGYYYPYQNSQPLYYSTNNSAPVDYPYYYSHQERIPRYYDHLQQQPQHHQQHHQQHHPTYWGHPPYYNYEHHGYHAPQAYHQAPQQQPPSTKFHNQYQNSSYYPPPVQEQSQTHAYLPATSLSNHLNLTPAARGFGMDNILGTEDGGRRRTKNHKTHHELSEHTIPSFVGTTEKPVSPSVQDLLSLSANMAAAPMLYVEKPPQIRRSRKSPDRFVPSKDYNNHGGSHRSHVSRKRSASAKLRKHASLLHTQSSSSSRDINNRRRSVDDKPSEEFASIALIAKVAYEKLATERRIFTFDPARSAIIPSLQPSSPKALLLMKCEFRETERIPDDSVLALLRTRKMITLEWSDEQVAIYKSGLRKFGRSFTHVARIFIAQNEFEESENGDEWKSASFSEEEVDENISTPSLNANTVGEAGTIIAGVKSVSQIVEFYYMFKHDISIKATSRRTLYSQRRNRERDLANHRTLLGIKETSDDDDTSSRNADTSVAAEPATILKEDRQHSSPTKL